MKRVPLFPTNVSVVRDDGLVLGKSDSAPACRPHWLMGADGHRYVGKLVLPNPPAATGPISPLRALSEVAVAAWSSAFGVRVPTVRLLDFDGELWVGSVVVPDARPASPAAVASVLPVEAVSQLFALDVFIGNHDRHDGNVLVASDADAMPRLYAIDHERTALGMHDVEGDFTSDFREVMFHAVLRAALRRDAAIAAATGAREKLGDTDRLVEVLRTGNMWCKVDTPVVDAIAAVLPARVALLPDLVAAACSHLGVDR